MNNQPSDQLSLFDLQEEQVQNTDIIASNKFDVVRMEYAGAESMIWEDLFSGYKSLK